jgi:uncharacterized FlgJ-related protein
MLTWDNISWYLDYYHVQCPDIVKTQIKHETGNLTSRICKEDKNLFGMNYPAKRKTTAIGKDIHKAIYPDWQRSIEDYKIFQNKYYKGGDYFLFLINQGYAEDKNYIKKLRSYEQNR